MRDHERDTGIGHFEEWDSEIITETNREPGCLMSRIYEEIDLLSPWKAPGEEAILG